MDTKEKNPNRVKAGQERQRQRRAELGEEGYREAQRKNAYAANRVQLETLGAEGYREQRKVAYQALVDKIGLAAARQRARNGIEASRQRRLANPSRGEQIAHIAVARLGYSILRLETPLELLDIQQHPTHFPSIKHTTAIVECYIARRWIGDIVLPFDNLVIEVDGGCHRLTSNRDQMRRQSLEALGLQVVVLLDEDRQLTVEGAMHVVQAMLSRHDNGATSDELQEHLTSTPRWKG